MRPLITGTEACAGELVDLRLLEGADHDRAEEAREHERRVAVALAARELQVGGGKVERHSAELGDADLEADTRPRRRLVEDQPDRPAGEDAQLLPAGALLLQLVGEVERGLELLARPVADPREAAPLQQLGDPRHGAILVDVANLTSNDADFILEQQENYRMEVIEWHSFVGTVP